MVARWLCVYIYFLSAQVSARYISVSEESVTPKPFFLGLSIG